MSENEVKKSKKGKAMKKKKDVTDLQGNVIKKQSENNTKKKKNIKQHFKERKKLYIIIALLLCLIAICFCGYIGVRNYILNKKYSKYESQMDLYGFSLMYNNKSSKSTEKISRIEMVKIILSSIYNTTKVDAIGFESKKEFKDDEWARTAEAFEIIKKGYITKDTYNDTVTYKEALETYLKARSKLKEIPISSTKESSFKNLQSFNQDERSYINDATENGLITDSKKNINIDNTLFKGQFNELVVRFVEKYNTVAPDGDVLVTKTESKPSNYKIYPYILYSVNKEVYEYKGVSEGEGDYKTPAETYKYKKDLYPQMQYRLEKYYNTILNIDYRNINKDEFYENVDMYLRYEYDDEIYKYINFVKENKIIIEGNAKVQLPIFYLDGIRYRARVKLTFEIKNSNTSTNLLLGDTRRNAEVKYKNKKYTTYIDAPLGTTLLSKALYLDMEPIIDIRVDDTQARNANEF